MVSSSNFSAELGTPFTDYAYVRPAPNFKRAGVDQLVTIVEGDAHETVKKLKEPIDLLFLDADPKGYLDYLDKIGHLVRPGGLIVTHNVSRPAPDPAWVKRITTSPELNTVFLNLHAAGIAVSLKRKQP